MASIAAAHSVTQGGPEAATTELDPKAVGNGLPLLLRGRGKLVRNGRAWAHWLGRLIHFLGLDSLSGCGAVIMGIHFLFLPTFLAK